ncbi:MAG: Ig-like domain-containing protein [Lachnospiraceae bacterium]|nr:Ig-like domain-containing protein [Lachnospiraceae bacterium]
MKKSRIRQIAYWLCVVLTVQLFGAGGTPAVAGTLSGDTQTVTVSGADAGMLQTYGKGYFDVAGETLEEDKYPKVSMFALEAEGASSEVLPRSYRSDSVSVNGVAVSYLPDGFRNQNPYDTCWTFSALGACEASLVRKGLAKGNIDLSERHLAYYFYNKGVTGDPKGGAYGDYNLPTQSHLGSGETYLDLGGNSALTMWHLVSWCGPVAESTAPYTGILNNKTDSSGLLGKANSTQMAYGSDACHVQNVYKLPLGNVGESTAEQTEIKKMIMEYGALAISYYADSTYDSVAYDSYYNDSETGTNHAVQVVGWDDDFDKNHFEKNGAANPAPGNGAWLMKNSWGDESDYSAQPGYFWLSYYDASLNSYQDSYVEGGETVYYTVMRYAYVFDAEMPDNYDNIYQYDGDSMSSTVNFLSSEPLAMRFTAGSGNGMCEQLRSVGIGVAQTGVSGQIDIYKNLTNPTKDPVSGEKVLTQDFALSHAGYHTIPLEEGVLLPDGCEYSVVFRFDEDTDVYASRDYNESNEDWIESNPFYTIITVENPDVCFWQGTSGRWNDLGDGSDMIARIKAYTDNTQTPGTMQPAPESGNTAATVDSPAMLTGLALDRATATLTDGKSLQLVATPTYSAGRKTDWMVYWKSSNTSVATVTDYGKVKAKKPGKATITVYNGDIQAKCVVTVTPKKVSWSSATLTGTSKIVLKWKKTEGASGYQIYRATSPDGTYKKVKTVKGRSSVTATLNAWKGSKAYYYKVRAYKTISGKKVYGPFSSVKTLGPAKPAGVKAQAKSGKKIKITWKKVTGASGYEIYRATSQKGRYKKVKTVKGAGGRSFINKSLKKGKIYYYKVRAYKTVGGKKIYGPYSSVVSATSK